MDNMAVSEARTLGQRTQNSNAIGPLIVLVHGTWGSRSAWTEKDSILRARLREALPSNTEYFRFVWSGRNSHRARHRAGEELARLLSELNRQMPDRPIVLITHSHGGNVAMYSLKHLASIDHIRGIVAIATPFIHVRSRTLVEGTSNLLRLFAFVFIIMLVVYLVIGVTYLSSIFSSTSVQIILMIIVGSVGMALVDYIAEAMAKVPTVLQRLQEQLRSEVTVESADIVPVLSIIVRQDEARGWLSVIRWISNIPAQIFSAVGRTAQFRVAAISLVVFIIILAFAALLNSCISGGLERTPFLYPVLVALYIFEGITALWFAAPLLQLLMILLPWTLRSHALGYGGESFLHNWLLDISVSETPPSTNFEIHQFATADISDSGHQHSYLLHTRIYNSHKVCADIADWIRRNSA